MAMYKLTATLPNGLIISTQSTQTTDLRRIAAVKQAVSYTITLHGDVVMCMGQEAK